MADKPVKEKDENEEREFQVELIRVQLKYDNVNLVMTVVLSLIVSLMGVLAAVIYSGIFPPTIGSMLSTVFIVLIAITILTSIIVALIGYMGQKGDLKKITNKYVKKAKEKQPIKRSDAKP